MRIAFGAVAAFAVMSVPALAAEGHSGYFRVRVTEGSYSLYDPVTGGHNRYSLAGQIATLRWNSTVRYNVPSPSHPSMSVSKLITNSASIDTAGFGFWSSTTNDPYQDQGSARIGASYSGTADAGRFVVSYNCNSCPDHAVNFSFVHGLASAKGDGTASLVDDGRYDYFGQIKYEITGGRAFAAVPESPSWALMISGFGAIGAAIRRQRRSARLRMALL